MSFLRFLTTRIGQSVQNRKRQRHFRYIVDLTDRRFLTHLEKPAGRWYHLVMNYMGPNDGQGITVYTDGALRGSDTNKDTHTYTAGDGRLVIGRHYTDHDGHYESVTFDELTFWNRILTLQEIQALYNMHK